MIVKILSSASKGFHGVEYNEKKVDKGKGELLVMKNFPTHFNSSSGKEEIKNYLRAVSQYGKTRNPQFHAVISTKQRQHTREELQAVAEKFMENMGYGRQPYLVVFHYDTENNHVHIVSTRVDVESGKKIDDHWERLKSQKALQESLKVLNGTNQNKEINLLSYQFQNESQLKMLFERSGFNMSKDENGDFTILKNGVKQQTVSSVSLDFSRKPDEARKKQIRAIIGKYKNLYSNQVFEVIDPYDKNRNHFENELQKILKDKFGMDIIFHRKDDMPPFGYSLIDHKSKAVYKGSDLLKMKAVFELTDNKIDKKLFDHLQEYRIPDETAKKVIFNHYKSRATVGALQLFMLFESKTKTAYEDYKSFRRETADYIRNHLHKDYQNETINILKHEGVYYSINEERKCFGKLEDLVSEKDYKEFLNPSLPLPDATTLFRASSDMLIELLKISTVPQGGSDDEDWERKKKRRKR